MEKLKCPDCGCEHVVYDKEKGEAICGECGLVIDVFSYSLEPEWRGIEPADCEEKARAGMPVSLSIYDMGFATEISFRDRDAHGNWISPVTKTQMRRLRIWNKRNRLFASARNMPNAMSELSRLCDKLLVPHAVKEEAALIYRKVVEAGLIRGREVNAFVAASLYVACRKFGVMRTMKEIANESVAKTCAVRRCYRIILEALNIQVPLQDPIAYASRIASAAEISGESLKLAVEILKSARRKRLLCGAHPMCQAAAALYIACKLNGEEKRQADIAAAAGITEVSLRNNIKRICRRLGIRYK